MSVLTSATPALELNELVKNEISPILFISCNYAPATNYSIHWDGKFYRYVLNLYCFTVDTSCIISSIGKFIDRKERSSYTEFFDYMDQIKMLRAVLAHNNSNDGNYFEQKQLLEFSQWILTIIGKDHPETDDDYELLCEQLEHIADYIVQKLRKFICYVRDDKNRESLIIKWRDTILEWYCKKQNIYLGQLANIYLSKIKSTYRTQYELSKVEKRIYANLKQWIENSYLYSIQSRIDSREKLIPGLPTKAAVKIQAYIDEDKTELDNQKKQIEEKGGADNYFFGCLKKELIEILEKKPIDMLPQFLLQEHIRIHFDSIPIEDL